MVEIQNSLTSETLANADKMEDTKMYEWRKCQAQPDGTVQNGWLLKKDLSFLPASRVSIHISFLFDNWKSILYNMTFLYIQLSGYSTNMGGG